MARLQILHDPRHIILNMLIVAVLLLSLIDTGFANTRSQKIINGTNVPAGQYSWMVALIRNDRADPYLGQFCGGTLIHPEWVLTAAHCVSMARPARIAVVLNKVVLNKRGLRRITVDKIVAPPRYVQEGVRDLALLHLSERVDDITPVQLVSASGEITGEGEYFVMGWGRSRSDRARGTKRLKIAPQEIVNTRICNRPSNHKRKVVGEHEICGISPNKTSGACSGDSGGPLFFENAADGQTIQLGIVSWGKNPCDVKKPEVYTRVSSQVSWIQSQINGSAPESESHPLTLGVMDYCVNLECDFDAHYLHYGLSDIGRVEWDFGDGTTDEGVRLRHQFPVAGIYNIKLKMTRTNGSLTNHSLTIEVPSATHKRDRRIYTEYYYRDLDHTGDSRILHDTDRRETYFYDGIGTFEMTGPVGTDFDLYLYKFAQDRNDWDLYASSAGFGSAEKITTRLTRGYYYLRVTSYFGSGEAEIKTRAKRSRRVKCIYNSLRCRLSD